MESAYSSVIESLKSCVVNNTLAHHYLDTLGLKTLNGVNFSVIDRKILKVYFDKQYLIKEYVIKINEEIFGITYRINANDFCIVQNVVEYSNYIPANFDEI